MSRRALITGAAGQDGRYLIELLLQKQYDVHAHARQAVADDAIAHHVSWHIGDVTDPGFLESLLLAVRPDEIYNLASLSRPQLSWERSLETGLVNAFAPQRLFEIVRKALPPCRIYQASSSEIFGDSKLSPQNEDTPCWPHNPYAAAKLYAHQMAGLYRRRYRVFVCSGIMFNHESPRRPLSFVSQKIAHAAALVGLGFDASAELDERGEPILKNGLLALGNLDVRRDFGFAKDYVEAMWLMLQRDEPDDYVIGSGQSHSIREFCEIAFARIGRDWREHVVVDQRLVRGVDSHLTVADARKARRQLGWEPQTTFRELVVHMVDCRTDALRARAKVPVVGG